ncbi:MAG: DUF747-domain-containing [Lasallia pustulata]|uniref:DUF747-domain-containing n=1 Tax=Lasallia pustulata TaxID=136370 RepID=A0A5M8PUG6_9LECA|nr:MAG: DUF747-domain-containing [Lasallia pustulata]
MSVPYRAYRAEGHSTSSTNGGLTNNELEPLEHISKKAKSNRLREQLDGEEQWRPEPMGHAQLISPELSPKLDASTEADSIVSRLSLPNGHSERLRNDGRHILAESDPASTEPLEGLGLPTSSRQADSSLRTIEEELDKTGEGNMKSPRALDWEREKVLKLSPAKIYELTSSPDSLPLQAAPLDLNERSMSTPLSSPRARHQGSASELSNGNTTGDPMEGFNNRTRSGSVVVTSSRTGSGLRDLYSPLSTNQSTPSPAPVLRPRLVSRTVSTPSIRGKPSSSKMDGAVETSVPRSKNNRTIPAPLQLYDLKRGIKSGATTDPVASPIPSSIPIPPLSMPTYLQLELSPSRPSPLYIHRSATSDIPYESSRVKIERLQNFFLLPPQLEQVLWFGTLACLDAWLYSFTILPLRFLKALYLLGKSWLQNITRELGFLAGFVYAGIGRMWRRRRWSTDEAQTDIAVDAVDGDHIKERIATDQMTPQAPRSASAMTTENPNTSHSHPESKRKGRQSHAQRPRRLRSIPSLLLPAHKADILTGLLIIISCTILMCYDASRMYHSIRGQAAIKLYVIYNVLEVCDRLLSALGQDVLECLFSQETLERKHDGRSKILRPFSLFMLALLYNIIHVTALFYQVITLNVAVNSYSNALLTLLMSNQFVEIKSTVFKKIEKENLFQLTCADVVERFQLWLMLVIIASRNIVETGGLSFGSSETLNSADIASSAPLRGTSILPNSFTIFPEWTSEVMGPFLLVLGSEMLVDWLKHAYITKFNSTKPAIYGRFLDVLAKDYYSNAFAEQSLTRRLGLPVIPLACLFIRASVQTYHMFLAAHMPPPYPSPATSISVDASTSSPATTAALQHIDHAFRRALGRSSFGGGPTLAASARTLNTDDVIAAATMLVFFMVLFLVLLALKLVLGMCLLSYARGRYAGMKEREKRSALAEGRRVGGWAVVEVDEDKRRWIYEDDGEGLRGLREREGRLGRRRRGVGGRWRELVGI